MKNLNLEDISAKNEFQCSLAEELGALKPILRDQNAADQQQTSASSALHEAAAHTIGYMSRNHQDLFDNTSDVIHTSLKAMHRGHQASLKNPSSTSAKQKWQRASSERPRTVSQMEHVCLQICVFKPDWFVEVAVMRGLQVDQ